MNYRRSSFLLLALLALQGRPASAQVFVPGPTLKTSPSLTVADGGAWRSIQKGVEFRHAILERAQPYQLILLKMVRFDTRLVAPRILRSSDYQLSGADVKTLAGKTGAIAAINASYFDEKGRPLGFLKTQADAIGSNVSKSSLFTGIFAIKDKVPILIHRDEFSPSQADQALQAGPLLLAKGTPLTVSLSAGRQSRRAVIGQDKERRLLIAVTDTLLGGLSWSELQELFGAPQWQINATDLLNLDGGGSAQLYVRGNQFEEYIAGATDVPVAIGLFPK